MSILAIRLSCLLLSASLACGAVRAAPLELPPIGGPGPVEHHVGKVVWADLVTPDLAASEHFYSALFGWSFRTVDSPKVHYAVASVDGRAIAGLLQKPVPAGERRQPIWLPFLAVKDVDTAERLAISHGARTIAAPKAYAGRGRQAVLEDPEGAEFAIVASSSGDPPDYLAEPGEIIWSSVFASNPTSSAAFYKSVIGYDVFDLSPSEDDATHEILSSDNYARAGVHTLPAGGRRRAHWLNFVRVGDAADAAQKAVSLGGRILEAAYVDRHGGRIAIIADPTGAPLGLMEWPQNVSQAEPK